METAEFEKLSMRGKIWSWLKRRFFGPILTVLWRVILLVTRLSFLYIKRIFETGRELLGSLFFQNYGSAFYDGLKLVGLIMIGSSASYLSINFFRILNSFCDGQFISALTQAASFIFNIFVKVLNTFEDVGRAISQGGNPLSKALGATLALGSNLTTGFDEDRIATPGSLTEKLIDLKNKAKKIFGFYGENLRQGDLKALGGPGVTFQKDFPQFEKDFEEKYPPSKKFLPKIEEEDKAYQRSKKLSFETYKYNPKRGKIDTPEYKKKWMEEYDKSNWTIVNPNWKNSPWSSLQDKWNAYERRREKAYKDHIFKLESGNI